jgi:hypothetical protein
VLQVLRVERLGPKRLRCREDRAVTVGDSEALARLGGDLDQVCTRRRGTDANLETALASGKIGDPLLTPRSILGTIGGGPR